MVLAAWERDFLGCRSATSDMKTRHALLSTLLAWLHGSVVERKRNGFISNVVYFARGNTVVFMLSVYHMMVHFGDLVDSVLSARKFRDIRKYSTHFLGEFTCMIAMLFMAYRRTQVGAALQSLIHVSQQLENGRSSPQGRELLAAGARSLRITMWAYVAFGSTMLLSIVPDVFIGPHTWFARQIHALTPGMWFVDVPIGAGQFIAMSCGVLAMHTSVFLLITTYRALATTLLALGQEFHKRHDFHALRRLAALHSELVQAAGVGNRAMFGDLYVYFLASSFVLPLLGTADVIFEPANADSLALGTIPLILGVFAPIAFAGQQEEDAWLRLSADVYSGPWMEEPTESRRVRQMVMLGNAASASVPVRGFGALNRSACVDALSTWFKYLNALLNMRKVK